VTSKYGGQAVSYSRELCRFVSDRSIDRNGLETRNCNFSTNSWEFSTEKNLRAQNFNFASKFIQNRNLQLKVLHFLKEKLTTTKITFSTGKISTQSCPLGIQTPIQLIHLYVQSESM